VLAFAAPSATRAAEPAAAASDARRVEVTSGSTGAAGADETAAEPDLGDALAPVPQEAGAAGTEAAPDPAAALAETELERARAFLAAGRLFPAEKAARRAVDAAPESAAAHHLLAQILIRRQKLAEATAALERSAALDPELPGIDRELGLVRFELGDFEGAREALERAVAREPDDAELRLRLGLAWLSLGELPRAEQQFELAARDPELRALALYNVGVTRELSGRRDRAREAYQRAIALDPSGPIGGRAAARTRALEPAKPDRSWSVRAGAGALYDSNVTRVELDRVTGEPDGAVELEFGADYRLALPAAIELDTGYDFAQTLYFNATDFDLQSHGLRASASRGIGPVDATLSYLFSLNTLGGDRFLDFHQLRASLGFAPTPWWYTSVAPALRVKRFDIEPRRDAEQASLGLMQLFPLGDWSRYVLLGFDLELEDTVGAEFDYRGLTTQLAFHVPIVVWGERTLPIDLRYRWQGRNYRNRVSAPSGRRQDSIHAVRLRIEFPLAGPLSLRSEYEFEDANSNLPSADFRSHTVGLQLRFSL
jgi:tetratricopeptide (TPR) repeat protein